MGWNVAKATFDRARLESGEDGFFDQEGAVP